MSTNNYPSNENVSRGFERITAFFSNQNDGYRALTELKQHGFTNEQIGFAALGDDSSDFATDNWGGPTERIEEIDSEYADPHNAEFRNVRNPGETRHRSLWRDIKNLFKGESHHEAVDFKTSTSGLDWSEERFSFYSRGLQSGGCIVTFAGGNGNEGARRILERCGGDLRESGFESYGGEGQGRVGSASEAADRDIAGVNRSAREAGSRLGTNTSDFRQSDQRRIQLRGELLRAHKERIQRAKDEDERMNRRKPAA